jgi:uncharacterized protein YkwD
MHNEIRRLAGAGNLVWDEGLAQDAEQYSRVCVLRHATNRNGAGENLGIGAAPDVLTKMWIEEGIQYQNGGGFSSAVGHYTQVVWKGTTRIGCGMFNVFCEYMILFIDK